MVERINPKEIEKEAKQILDKFAKALEKVKDEGESFVDRADFERDEGEGELCEGFKQKILDNAPKSNSDFIIGEKGSWKNKG